MEVSIKFKAGILKAYVVRAEASKTCVLFLSGGSISVGKERYREWQDNLNLAGINSISFDYSGVNDSGMGLTESSLKSRIEESIYMSDWMKEHIKVELYILYGVSMGGYIGIGLINQRPHIFKKLILHAPAAYSPKAHTLCFGENFTHELRTNNDWINSLSFEWLREYKDPILFIESEDEEIIPDQIIKKYKSLITENKKFKTFVLGGAKHNIWGSNSQEKKFREKVYETILNFIE
ncbi:MAG: alpha/beta hydrolase [bacterium]|nr:alpha/beta hydrolase [bacterium]